MTEKDRLATSALVAVLFCAAALAGLFGYWVFNGISEARAEREAANNEFIRANGGKVIVVEETYKTGKYRGWRLKCQGCTNGEIIEIHGPREKEDDHPRLGERWLLLYENGSFQFDREVD